MHHCSSQHQTLLPSPVTSTAGHFSFCLCLFILSGVFPPLFSSSILGTYRYGSSSLRIISFCHFILFMGFSCLGLEASSSIRFVECVPKAFSWATWLWSLWICFPSGVFSPHVTHSTLLQEEFFLKANAKNSDSQDLFVLLIKNLNSCLYKSQWVILHLDDTLH